MTARFNLNLLARLNRELQADFDLDAFSHVARYNRGKSQMEIYVQSQKSQVVSIPGAGLRVMFRRGELVRTEISRKFTRRQVEALLGAAQMRLTGWYTDAENRLPLGWRLPSPVTALGFADFQRLFVEFSLGFVEPEHACLCHRSPHD